MQWKVTKRRGEMTEAVPFYALWITLKECKWYRTCPGNWEKNRHVGTRDSITRGYPRFYYAVTSRRPSFFFTALICFNRKMALGLITALGRCLSGLYGGLLASKYKITNCVHVIFKSVFWLTVRPNGLITCFKSIIVTMCLNVASNDLLAPKVHNYNHIQ